MSAGRPAAPDATTGSGRGIRRPRRGSPSDYRRGYLCGIVRGDGHRGRRVRADRPMRSAASAVRGAGRGRRLPARVPLRRRPRRRPPLPPDARAAGRRWSAWIVPGRARAVDDRGGRRAAIARCAVARPTAESLRHVLTWPWDADAQWSKGFLAGVFDADGSCGEAAAHRQLRPGVLRRAADCLRQLGFRSPSSRTTTPTGCAACGCCGGTAEHLRFFHTVDPAIPRKCSLEGRALKFAGRAAGRVDRAARVRDADVRHHDGHRRLHRQRRGEPQLLRPADARVPGPRRGPGLRARDRRQGQRARGAARGAARGRRGRASASRSARTRTRISGSRAATS